MMLRYFDKNFKATQSQIYKKYKDTSRKRAIHNDYSFNSKGNPSQFKFNSGLQEDIEDIL